MQRRARDQNPTRPSLFPFMSVLVCLIGTLMFMAAALASNSMSSLESNMQIEIRGTSLNEHDRHPIIVECGEGRATVTGRGLSFDSEREKDALSSSAWRTTPFVRFLSGLKRREYVLFIVRPEGLDSFAILRAALLRHRRTGVTIDYGSELIPSDWGYQLDPEEG